MENRAPIFREIHKNTWLKRLNNDGSRKLSVGHKKNERFWVVFCVHDDCEALLEGYSEPRMAPSHSPDWTVSLQNTMHISHTLVGSEHEFEFVITSHLEVFRFSAPSWDCMKEWVEALRSKLREMKIISPKENVYSRLPESRLPLLPTRDPTSPLPPPPASAIPALVPGVEVVQPSTSASSSSPSPLNINPLDEVATSSNDHPNNSQPESLLSEISSDSSESTSSFVLSAPPLSNTTSRSIMNLLSNPIQAYRSENQPSTSKAATVVSTKIQQEPTSLAKIFTDNVLSKSPADNQANSRFDFSNLIDSNELINSEAGPSTSREKLLKIPRPHTSKTKSQTKEEVTISTLNNGPNDGGDTDSTNITIIQLSETNESTKESPSSFLVSGNEHEPISSPHDTFNVQIIPSSIDAIPKISTSNESVTTSSQSVSQNVTVVATDHKTSVQLLAGASTPVYAKPLAKNRESTKKILVMPSTSLTASTFNTVTNISINEESSSSASPSNFEYEPIFIKPVSSTPLNKSATDYRIVETISSNSGISRHRSLGNSADIQPVQPSQVEIKQRQQIIPSGGSPTVGHLLRNGNSAMSPPPSSSRSTSRNIPVLMRGMTEVSISRPSRIDRNQNRVELQPPSASKRAEMKAAIENLRKETQEQQRRRSSSTSDIHTSRVEERQKSPTARANKPVSNTPHIPRLTLREQQVMHLRTEMMHPGGVRLQLRRKECINSIGWVDAFGAVWVAGWKQKEHPILYNALHIGDQLISIGSITVTSAAEANKIIRSSQSLYVELIIRRIPFGRVYAIRRDMDGQCLGIIRDGNTATIVDIVPNSLVARNGLPPKAKSCDGLSLSFWVLTEINGRPLNLFFKDTEVRDRLNAVGRDISILVQPSDLVTKLKKQLKTYRNHKDFIVQ